MLNKRLFIVSNRMPVSIEQQKNGPVMRQSSGGLVSAINAYLNRSGHSNFTKTFWAGVPDSDKTTWTNATVDKAPTDHEFIPVFVDPETYEGYYNGFSNSLLWPLFHYFPSFVDYHTYHFDAYLKVNELFCSTLVPLLKKDDIVWIHDYHLLPLAAMLRKAMPTLTIGLFLHIPFPSFELLRIIPRNWQKELLAGMLGADLIGFHTYDYAQHFLHSVEKILRIVPEDNYVAWETRQVKADVFPISIDYDHFHDAHDLPDVVQYRERYLEMKNDKKMIFSVDRLDYTKGISNRLKGFEKFLDDNPDYIGKVIFVLILVPSRDAIIKYAERKKMIDEYISNINSRIGTITWQPVVYQYGHLTFPELIALYTACDLALITPIRDGMNLVAKEFVASRNDQKGVLILSEMAGAASELTEALSINPNDADEIAAMIKVGLEMDATEQAGRLDLMQAKIKRYDVNTWATNYFNKLDHVKNAQLEYEVCYIDNTTKIELLTAYSTSPSRLILLDYDGTLVRFAQHHSLASPPAEVLDMLKKLSDDPLNDVYIISGRDSATLEKWLGHLDIGIISEHGARIRPNKYEWHHEIQGQPDKWMGIIEHIMDRYASKCPNTFVEKKEFSIAWHYRNAEPAQGLALAKELYDELLGPTLHFPLNVLKGNKVVEVRIKGVNKGAAVERIVAEKPYDLILAIGDDETDEDMFKKLARSPHAFTIKVGAEASFAKYNLHNVQMVVSLLETLSSYSTTKQKPMVKAYPVDEIDSHN